jgi:hypothetical protein
MVQTAVVAAMVFRSRKRLGDGSGTTTIGGAGVLGVPE